MLVRDCCFAARSSLGLSVADGLALPSDVGQPASGPLAEAQNVAPEVTTTSSFRQSSSRVIFLVKALRSETEALKR